MDRRWRKVLAWGVLVLNVAAWLSISWLRWPDYLIDFGRELYIPWQISQGKVLYKDLYFDYGPLIQYFHAFLFKCFGTGLSVLIFTNFIFLFLTVYVIYFIFKFLKGHFAGIMTATVFLGIFAFGHYRSQGNYNYICPYSHELVDGFALSLIGLLSIWCWLKQSKFIYLMIVGLLTGLISLTKIEIFIAFFGSVMLALILDAIHRRVSVPRFFKECLCVFCFALIAPGVFICYMSYHVSFYEVPHVLYGAFVTAKQIGFAHIIFFKRLSGFDDPRGNLLLMLKSAGGYVLAVFSLGALSFLISQFKSKRMRFLMVLLLGLIDVLVCMSIKPVSQSIALILRGAPLILLAVILMGFYQFFKGPPKGKDLSKLIFWIVFSTYALILTFKILLFVNPFTYGFVLAVPGTLIIVVMLTNDFACFGRGKFYYPKVFRALAIVFLLGLLVVHWRWSKGFYERMNYPIAQGPDRFLSFDNSVLNIDNKSVLMNSILQWINKNTSPSETLTVMPDGVMINYLSRREDPLKEYLFFPGTVNFLGEDKIIDLLKKASPFYLILIHRDMSEYGAQTFGVDYGKRIYQWILRNYKNEYIWWRKDPAQIGHNSPEVLAFLMQRNVTMSLADLDKAIALNPNNYVAYKDRASVYFNQGQYLSAVQDLNSAISLAPGILLSYFNRAVIYTKLGKYTLALTDLDRVIAANPNAEDYFNRGIVYGHQSKFDQAIADFDRAIAMDPNYANAYNNRAVCYFKIKDYIHSWQDVRKAQALGLSVSPKLLKSLEVIGAH